MQEVMLQILANYILMLEFSSLLEKIIGNAALVCVPGDGEKKKHEMENYACHLISLTLSKNGKHKKPISFSWFIRWSH
jgi:hypothetical protein